MRTKPNQTKHGGVTKPAGTTLKKWRCDWLDVMGPPQANPQSPLDIHLLSDHLTVTFPWICPVWSPRVPDNDADMHCWCVTGFWRGPRASSRLRQVVPYMMSNVWMDGLWSKTHSHLQSLIDTKGLTRESAQEPLELAALSGFVRRMTSSY